MGINVYKNGQVVVDLSHENLVDMSVNSNPTYGSFDGIRVTYVFRRRSRGDDNDGNPLIYALKGTRGYRIQNMHTAMLFARANLIIGNFAAGIVADYVLDVPSSKPLCLSIARMVAGCLGVPLLPSSFLQKKTVGEVVATFDANKPTISNAKKRSAVLLEAGLLAKADPLSTFEVKSISKPARSFFPPFKIAHDPGNLAGARILLVDDLVSSGVSLISTAQCLRSMGAVVEDAVALLSDLSAVRR